MYLILSQARSAQPASHSVQIQECPACISLCPEAGVSNMYLILSRARSAQHVSHSVQSQK